MKILVSAVSCNPYRGSEPYVGWSAVRALARDHELWVLTRRRRQPDLERAAAEGQVPANVHFVYAGDNQSWRPNRMWAKLQSWRGYQQFSREILPIAQTLHAREKFDLAHHVTFATWRVASPLWQLGIPFIFGPIGGYTNVPARMLSTLSAPALGFELMRKCSNLASRISPSVRACLCNANQVLAADAETGALARQIRGMEGGVSILSQAFFRPETVGAFATREPGRERNGVLKLFAGGNIIGTKGVSLALEALALAKAQGVKFVYRVGNGGVEVSYAQRLARKLGFKAEEVVFGEPLHGLDYRRELWESHAFLMPSLRESAGLTMMEAMLAGCVPVVADCGGPGVIVTPDCGIKIPVTTPRQMAAQLAEAIITLDRNRGLIREMGQAASRRIAQDFSEENYRVKIKAVYQAALLSEKSRQIHLSAHQFSS